MALSLKFANGAVGSLVGSYDSSYAYPGTHRVEVNGTDGRVLIDDTVKRICFPSKRGTKLAKHGKRAISTIISANSSALLTTILSTCSIATKGAKNLRYMPALAIALWRWPMQLSNLTKPVAEWKSRTRHLSGLRRFKRQAGLCYAARPFFETPNG